MQIRAVSRETQRDCVVNGIPLEKGVGIRADIYSLHYDRDVWGDDIDDFRPERYVAGSRGYR